MSGGTCRVLAGVDSFSNESERSNQAQELAPYGALAATDVLSAAPFDEGGAWLAPQAVVDRLTVHRTCESLSYMGPALAQGSKSGRGFFGGVMLALRILSGNGLLLLAACAPLLMTGCNAIFWGNLGVLCVTVGIFLGTVFLSRSSTATRSAAARSVAPGATPSVVPPASRG